MIKLLDYSVHAVLFVILVLVVGFATQHQGTLTVLEAQPVRKCVSMFDDYMVYDYVLVDDNTTLITSYGRIYNLGACEVVHD